MDRQRANEFMVKLVGDMATALAANLLVVGDRLGLFAAMAGAGPLSAAELAARTGIAPRYAEEWLAVMAGAGYVLHDGERFELPAEHARSLVNTSSEHCVTGLFASLPLLAAMVPQLSDAFRSGGGIGFAEFGAELPEALAAMNRALYEQRLISAWLPAVPGVVQRLQAGGRALDVGCGAGVVPITLARAYPQAEVAGMDLDARSIAMARAAAEAAGVRVRFEVAAIDALAAGPGWDLVSCFDVIHDLPDPLGALQHIRRALTPGGTFLMVEPKVADELADNLGNPFARMLYGLSCLHCVPQSLAQGGPGLGACWGERRARALAAQAGFERFERLEIRNPSLAFYALG